MQVAERVAWHEGLVAIEERVEERVEFESAMLLGCSTSDPEGALGSH
ncbi:MAG TPA: hypothetical protein VK802_20735 [Streptosporangiaceae bacterium]|nr:hypothetical protein [Streptosporangiaceae bacterium]